MTRLTETQKTAIQRIFFSFIFFSPAQHCSVLLALAISCHYLRSLRYLFIAEIGSLQEIKIGDGGKLAEKFSDIAYVLLEI